MTDAAAVGWGKRTALAFVVSSFALTACSKGSDKAADPASTPVTGGASASSETSGTKGKVESSPQQLGPVVATATTSGGGFPIKVELHQLKRSGALVTLNFSVTNTAAESTGVGWQVGSFFDNGDPLDSVPDRNSIDGVYLVDNVNKKRYPVAHDSKKACVCSSVLSGAFVEAGRTQTFSATFGAPAADVKAVDVAIPKVSTFSDVPLQ